MVSPVVDPLRGVVYLAGGLLALVFVVLLLVDPGMFVDLHPLPLVVLLSLAAVIALYRAWVLLR